MTARLVELILSDDARAGRGENGDPLRVVYQLYTPDGRLVATWDTWEQTGQVHAAITTPEDPR